MAWYIIMKPSVLSFLDEMQKIASQKEAGMLKNVGSWALKHGDRAKWNSIIAMRRLAQPQRSLSRGVRFIKRDFKNSNPFWKAMTAYGFISGAPEAFAHDDPSGQDRSRLNRMTRFAGSQAGNLIGAPYGVVGGTLASLAGEGAGAIIGKGIDKARGIKLKKPHRLEPNVNPTPLQMVAPQV